MASIGFLKVSSLEAKSEEIVVTNQCLFFVYIWNLQVTVGKNFHMQTYKKNHVSSKIDVWNYANCELLHIHCVKKDAFTVKNFKEK